MCLAKKILRHLLKSTNFEVADGSWVTATLDHMYITLLKKTNTPTKYSIHTYHYQTLYQCIKRKIEYVN